MTNEERRRWGRSPKNGSNEERRRWGRSPKNGSNSYIIKEMRKQRQCKLKSPMVRKVKSIYLKLGLNFPFFCYDIYLKMGFNLVWKVGDNLR